MLFEMELQAVRLALEGLPRPFLEIGAGSGRFTEALALEVGVDPARAALDVFARRLKDRPQADVQLVQATGEALPFADASFGAGLLVVTLCFAGDPPRLIQEAA
ncbi:MAG: class I SAM-dependent methyltransferase, partial [Bacillota bacterium]